MTDNSTKIIEFKFWTPNPKMKTGTVVFILIIILFSLSTAHATISLNMEYAPFVNGGCLTPSQLQTAYGFNSIYNTNINGAGENIAIVVARGDPSIISDINAFDSYYGLPALANGSNLKIYYPFGSPLFTSVNWTAETALDVETVHELAPGANIYLVVAPNSSWLFNAINYSINVLPVNTISLSWGAPENSYSNQDLNILDGILATAIRKQITVFAASGDEGAYNGLNYPNVNFPASSPNVISVGGTILSYGSNGVYFGETAWNGSGGGYSSIFSKPSVQPNISDYRIVPDVSFNAGAPVCVYVSSHWAAYYGTSAAAPAWAAFDSLVNEAAHGSGTLSMASLYHTYYEYGGQVFNLITSGNNGYYYANGGYNAVTGIGTPKAYQLLQALSKETYQLSFTSNVPNTIFDINGVNYSAPVSLNFSFGESVDLNAYVKSTNAAIKYFLSSYSGYVNSSNSSILFSVFSSSSIDANFSAQYRVTEYNVYGYTNTSRFINSSQTFDISSSLKSSQGSTSYSLLGYSIDHGPLIHSASGFIPVYSPLNITFYWLKGIVTNFVFNGCVLAANSTQIGSIRASYIYYQPLLNSTKNYSAYVENNGTIFTIPGTVINYSGIPQYSNSNRCTTYNGSAVALDTLHIVFFQQSKYKLNFVSSTGSSLYPTRVVITSANTSWTFDNNTVWANSGENFFINKVIFGNNELNTLSTPLLLSPSNAIGNITLPVSNVAVSVSLYLGIPIIAASVTFHYGNISITNSTNLGGVATFSKVPDTNYNISINAYGTSYTYNGLRGNTQTFQITPFLYQIYLISFVVSVMLVVFGVYEEVKHKSRLQKQR